MVGSIGNIPPVTTNLYGSSGASDSNSSVITAAKQAFDSAWSTFESVNPPTKQSQQAFELALTKLQSDTENALNPAQLQEINALVNQVSYMVSCGSDPSHVSSQVATIDRTLQAAINPSGLGDAGRGHNHHGRKNH